MKTIQYCLGLLSAAGLVSAQPAPDQQRALVNTILEELEPQAMTLVQRGPNGRYQLQPKQPPVLRLLLLDRSYTGLAGRLLLAADDTPYNQRLRQHFSADDLLYMRRQLTMTSFFRHQQATIPQPWVRVLPMDTLRALRQRLGWQAEFRFTDSLAQRYGSYTTFAISKPLFSEDHTRALVNVAAGSDTSTCVYQKTGTRWRRKEVLYIVISD
ncbi:hypothetical protein [Hymenobacter lucidus]|uniref:Uncharacterized protein n=1 Tax=Hymenobacter lucidus TaxID=2880930 RepID=A0ABS8AM22_9BACT|nr:hypothetical protein [Hymenobacter lucidus]MCB2407189.1 hypothetical protein [Hymenobacter lucidus]